MKLAALFLLGGANNPESSAASGFPLYFSVWHGLRRLGTATFHLEEPSCQPHQANPCTARGGGLGTSFGGLGGSFGGFGTNFGGFGTTFGGASFGWRSEFWCFRSELWRFACPLRSALCTTSTSTPTSAARPWTPPLGWRRRHPRGVSRALSSWACAPLFESLAIFSGTPQGCQLALAHGSEV